MGVHFENIFIMVNILYLLVLSVNGFNLPKLSLPKIEFKPLFPTKSLIRENIHTVTTPLTSTSPTTYTATETSTTATMTETSTSMTTSSSVTTSTTSTTPVPITIPPLAPAPPSPSPTPVPTITRDAHEQVDFEEFRGEIRPALTTTPPLAPKPAPARRRGEPAEEYDDVIPFSPDPANITEPSDWELEFHQMFYLAPVERFIRW